MLLKEYLIRYKKQQKENNNVLIFIKLKIALWILIKMPIVL